MNEILGGDIPEEVREAILGATGDESGAAPEHEDSIPSRVEGVSAGETIHHPVMGPPPGDGGPPPGITIEGSEIPPGEFEQARPAGRRYETPQARRPTVRPRMVEETIQMFKDIGSGVIGPIVLAGILYAAFSRRWYEPFLQRARIENSAGGWVGTLLDQTQNNGGEYLQTFFDQARQQGVDPQDINTWKGGSGEQMRGLAQFLDLYRTPAGRQKIKEIRQKNNLPTGFIDNEILRLGDRIFTWEEVKQQMEQGGIQPIYLYSLDGLWQEYSQKELKKPWIPTPVKEGRLPKDQQIERQKMDSERARGLQRQMPPGQTGFRS